jgi:hypothetical protein
MAFFCSCRICKVNSKNGKGKILSTKKTFKKHQKREKATIKETEEELESSNESILSCNEAEKRKFEESESDELESDELVSIESDVNSANNNLDNNGSLLTLTLQNMPNK